MSVVPESSNKAVTCTEINFRFLRRVDGCKKGKFDNTQFPAAKIMLAHPDQVELAVFWMKFVY